MKAFPDKIPGKNTDLFTIFISLFLYRQKKRKVKVFDKKKHALKSKFFPFIELANFAIQGCKASCPYARNLRTSFIFPENSLLVTDGTENTKRVELFFKSSTLFQWWTIRDSNPGPIGYEPTALTN